MKISTILCLFRAVPGRPGACNRSRHAKDSTCQVESYADYSVVQRHREQSYAGAKLIGKTSLSEDNFIGQGKSLGRGLLASDSWHTSHQYECVILIKRTLCRIAATTEQCRNLFPTTFSQTSYPRTTFFVPLTHITMTSQDRCR